MTAGIDHAHDAPLPCAASEPARSGMALPLPGVDDAEGLRLDPDLPFVVDAHVHLFVEPLFRAIWRWFDEHGWPIRYKLTTPRVLDFLLGRGLGHVVALHYAHKPGIARGMNAFMAEVVAANAGRVTGMATVFPGEEDAASILEDAFALGLRGVKMHCHVQCMAPDDERLDDVYRACVRHDLPLVLHAGREPKSPAYRCDPYELCSADRVDRVLRAHPSLRLCVPHLGADEFEAYARLLEQHERLVLDTTMMLADYFPVEVPVPLFLRHPERILYGTDFPNLPYAWDREVRRLKERRLPDASLEAILSGNARRFFRIEETP